MTRSNPRAGLGHGLMCELHLPSFPGKLRTSFLLRTQPLNVPPRDFRQSVNPFVEQAVQYSVAASNVVSSSEEGRKDALQKLLLQGLDITILGSNDFYSYRNQIEACGLPLAPESLAAIPLFSSITFNVEEANGAAGKCKPDVAKTGLGSSAAMTTSVVAALLHYLGAVNLPLTTKSMPEQKSLDSDLDLVHIIAQSAHCIAQGKVGSGFDVSAAVYGSQCYVRFSPAVLSSAQVTGGNNLAIIGDVLKEKWDHEKSKFSLPPSMTLLLGEPGAGGSSTPSMVGSVKQWQKADPQKSQETWRRLADANSKLETQFKILNKFAGERRETYNQIISSCSAHVHSKWMEQVADQHQKSVIKTLLEARDAFLEIRFHMQQMGNAAGVPIEPESQTRLLDATMSMEGVLLAGVPGAGGFDAVFAIILGESTDAVSKAWSSRGVLPLLVREDPRGVSLETSDPRANGLTSAVSSVKLN
ncbi:phosphomevalonate kinase, peroxisomal-like isoform X2 [Asparagus officinalis]|uniref:phosphomevalonate kinase, peroxisomal-like isoform X2 n=1 Tax=Asparagus officinalis TaxID=4686 RepID=UPI00098E0EBC|nr:phosphomevalonate kinase, peroxisomal-like isoform X2 [Asparagus officinalis]XP_020256691.1 phosphomevalonate kinase, peroxisomal-like isoform X2 [Asparagus officinalis]